MGLFEQCWVFLAGLSFKAVCCCLDMLDVHHQATLLFRCAGS